jgi:hypothetical protein
MGDTEAVPIDLYDARQKYSTGAYYLAIGDGDLRTRLIGAYIEASGALSGLGEPARAVSDTLELAMRRLDARMTVLPPTGNTGRVQTTVDSMSDEQVRDAAGDLLTILVMLYEEVYGN